MKSASDKYDWVASGESRDITNYVFGVGHKISRT